MTRADQRLAALGWTLPSPTPTVFSYAPAIRYRDTVHVAGQIPKTAIDTLLVEGVVGDGLDDDALYPAVRLCILHALAWVAHFAGGSLDAVEQVLRVDYSFQVEGARAGRLSRLADAGSALLTEVFQERGRHPRSVRGVHELPRNAPVLVSMDVALAPRTPGPAV